MLKSVYDDIKEEGGEVTVVYTTKPTLNSLTEVLTAGTSTSFQTYGVKESFELKEFDGNNIKYGDIKMLIPQYGFPFDFEELFNLCEITIGSKNWTVVFVDSLKPGDTAYLYTVHLRG